MLLDQQRLRELMPRLVAELGGDWLLVGGALVALWLEPRRVTADIDLIGMDGSHEQRLGLMKAATTLGLPFEALNSAADFFVYRIADWRDQLVVFLEAGSCRVFRPNATLFILLKMNRLSEQDLDDCTALLRQAVPESLDRPRLQAALRDLPPATSPEAAAGRDVLAAAIAARG